MIDVAAKSTSLFIYDSARSSTSSVRDSFVYNMKKLVNEGKSDYLTKVIEKGVFDIHEDDQFVPFEHVAYARKGIPAITITLKEEPYEHRYQKYSILDRDLCLCKLSRVLFTLNEAVA